MHEPAAIKHGAAFLSEQLHQPSSYTRRAVTSDEQSYQESRYTKRKDLNKTCTGQNEHQTRFCSALIRN